MPALNFSNLFGCRKQVNRAIKEGIVKQSRISELQEQLKAVERQRNECEGKYWVDNTIDNSTQLNV